MKVTLSWENETDRKRIIDLLGNIYQTNRIATYKFIKLNGEPRVIQGICKAYRYVKGTGTKAQSAIAKFRKTGTFQVYELQITREELEIVDSLNLQEKITGFKSMRISNILSIRTGKDLYEMCDNKIQLKQGKNIPAC